MRYKLIAFDMSGVIFKDINFWMTLHERFGTLKKGRELTDKYLYTDYKRLVDEVVVKLWKGKDAAPYFALVESMTYLDGVEETLRAVKKKGYITAIISASCLDAARRVQKDFGIDCIFANGLLIRDGKVSGDFVWPIGAGNERKAEALRSLCSQLGIAVEESIFVGDSNTDLEAFRAAGLSIAFNSSSDDLKAVADKIVEGDDLSDILEHVP
jgi:HAD superfamily phosphoserine phosphatase-like hydrolase